MRRHAPYAGRVRAKGQARTRPTCLSRSVLRLLSEAVAVPASPENVAAAQCGSPQSGMLPLGMEIGRGRRALRRRQDRWSGLTGGGGLIELRSSCAKFVETCIRSVGGTSTGERGALGRRRLLTREPPSVGCHVRVAHPLVIGAAAAAARRRGSAGASCAALECGQRGLNALSIGGGDARDEERRHPSRPRSRASRLSAWLSVAGSIRASSSAIRLP